MSFAPDFPADLLDDVHRAYLEQAIEIVLEEIRIDIDDNTGPDCFSVSFGYLPESQAHLYDVDFFVRFLATLEGVATKLAQPGFNLNSTAEELALRAFIHAAEAELAAQGLQPDFDSFRDDVCEDFDVDFLFDPAFDGIGDSELGQQMGIANLVFADWFVPFRAEAAA